MVLAALGMGDPGGEAGLYASCLQAIADRNLSARDVSVAMVTELARLVYVKPRFSKEPVPKEKLSRQEFCHVLAFMADRRGAETVDSATMKKLWNPQRLEKLSAKADQSKLWPPLASLPGFEMPVVEEREENLRGGSAAQEGAEMLVDDPEEGALERAEEDDYDDSNVETEGAAAGVVCEGHLAAAGLEGGSAAEVARLLAAWQGGQGDFTSGIVVEVMTRFGCPEIVRSLTGAAARLLGINTFFVNTDLWHRFRKLFLRTVELVRQGRAEPAEPWPYLLDLQQGGRLALRTSYLFHPPTRYEALVGRLAARVVRADRRCGHCGELGDLRACQGCLSAWFCSRRCHHQAWERGHQEECALLGQDVYGTAVLPVPMEGRELALFQSRNRYSGLYSQVMEQVTALRAELEELEEGREEDVQDREQLEELLRAARLKVKALGKSKGGLASSVVRIQMKEKPRVVETRVTAVQTGIRLLEGDMLVKLVPVEIEGIKYSTVFSGQELRVAAGRAGEGRAYGAPQYLRLATARQPGAATEVGRWTRQARAHQVVEVLGILGGGADLLAREQVLALVEELARLQPTLVEDVIKANPKLLKQMMTLSAEDAARFMAAVNMSSSVRRKTATLLQKFTGVRVFGSEAKVRDFQASRSELVSTEKLDAMKLLLHKTGKSEFPTLCPAVKVKYLPGFILELLRKVRGLDCKASSLANLDHPAYGGRLRVVFGGDKGGGIMRWVVELGGDGTHLVGLCGAHDSHPNMERYLTAGHNWMEQLRMMLRDGIVLEDEETGEVKIYQIDLKLMGDKAYQSEMVGHQGSAASFPILYDLTPSSHLRRAHLDGSPHNPAQPACIFPRRTEEGIDRDYLENRLDSRNNGDMRKNGKHHNSIVKPRLITLRSMSDIATATLHIGLGLGNMLAAFATLQARIKDGTASRRDLARLARALELLAGVEGEEGDGQGEEGQGEGAEQGEEEEGEQGEEEMDVDEDEDEALTPGEVELRRRRLEAEAECAEEVIKLEEMVEQEEDLLEMVEEHHFLIKRIDLAGSGDTGQLSKVVKKRTRMRRMDRQFRRCGSCCILTPYEGTVDTRPCSECGRLCHSVCEVVEGAELGEEDGPRPLLAFTCRQCSGTATYREMLELVKRQQEGVEAKVRQLRERLVEAELQAAAAKKEVKALMGPMERELERILEEDIGVKKTDYASCSFVGHHCDLLFEHAEKIGPVIPEDVRPLFLEFCAVIKRLQPLMKARRMLAAQEIDQLTADCHLVGELYPKLFRGNSITPKIHDLVFYVPEMARSAGTVGGLREEGLEAKHPIGNGLKRLLACVRNEEQKMRMMLQKDHLLQELRPGDLVKPVHSRKRRKDGQARQ